MEYESPGGKGGSKQLFRFCSLILRITRIFYEDGFVFRRQTKNGKTSFQQEKAPGKYICRPSDEPASVLTKTPSHQPLNCQTSTAVPGKRAVSSTKVFC